MAKLIIKETHIDSFNDTYNDTQTFDEGLNIICGKNEAGKSTLMEFIKNVFTHHSSTAKGYVKCSENDNEFKLINGNSKEITQNKKYIPFLTPHEYKAGFLINLDDLMFAKKSDSEYLVNIIKDSSGNKINEKEKEYDELIHKKLEFSLTPSDKISTNIKNQIKTLQDIEVEIKKLEENEEKYNNLCRELNSVTEEIKAIKEKYNCYSITLDKIKTIQEKLKIKVNSELLNKNKDFEEIVSDYWDLKPNKDKEFETNERLETIETTIKEKMNELLKLGFDSDLDKVTLTKDDFKRGKSLTESEKDLNRRKETTDTKLNELKTDCERVSFEIQKTTNQLEQLDIKDIKEYENDKNILLGYMMRYSDLADKVIKTETESAATRNIKNNNDAIMYVFLSLLLASLGVICMYWHSSVKYVMLVFVLGSFAGVMTTYMNKRLNSTKNPVLKSELTKIVSDTLKLMNKLGFKTESSKDFVVKIGACTQNMNDKIKDYKHTEENLLKQRLELEHIKSKQHEQEQELENIIKEIDSLNKEKSEFLSKIGFSSLENFEEIYSLIIEIKDLTKSKQELEQLKTDTINQTKNFISKLEKFITETGITELVDFNKHDFENFKPTIDTIDNLLKENIKQETLSKELDTKISEYEQELTKYPKELITDEVSLDELKKLDDKKTEKVNQQGRIEQEKESLEVVSKLFELRNMRNIELNRIKEGFAKLLQKEMVYRIIQLSKEKFNETQPNLISAKEYFKKITNEIYNDIDFENKTISGSTTGDKDWDNLSRGTKEQLYLAFRLGYADNYSKDIEGKNNGLPNLPLIIDDAFVNFDIERMKSVFRCLNEFSKNNQVLFFTCHTDTVVDLLKTEKIKYNLINI